MEIVYNHKYSKEEAYTKISSLLTELQKQYADQISAVHTKWDDKHSQMQFSLSIMGQNISGDILNEDKKLTLNGKLPFMLSMMSGQIEAMIRQKLDELFK